MVLETESFQKHNSDDFDPSPKYSCIKTYLCFSLHEHLNPSVPYFFLFLFFFFHENIQVFSVKNPGTNIGSYLVLCSWFT